MAVPPGVDPNDSRQPLVIGVISMLLVLAFTSVALRVYTRAVIVKAFGWDDAAAIFALVGIDQRTVEHIGTDTSHRV